MPPYQFVDPAVKTYSAQLQECSERHKFELKWKLDTKKVNGRDVHEFYPILNGIPYPQYKATSNSRQQDAKNKAAEFIILSGTLRAFMA
ncbi:hypothetical protein RSOL_108320, partial [Rhizoctonia solani AG-3 Rhs1AP]